MTEPTSGDAGDHLATKADLERLRGDLRAEMERLRANIERGLLRLGMAVISAIGVAAGVILAVIKLT